MEHSEAWALSSKVNMLEREELINLIGYYQEQARGTTELKKRMAEAVNIAETLLFTDENEWAGHNALVRCVIKKLEGR